MTTSLLTTTVGVRRRRLERELSRVEFARTLDVLERYLPEMSATVCDIGGGPGRYARWLAKRGRAVHLLDPVPLHVDQAREALKGYSEATATLGDARALPYPDAYADAVLLLGPLYHLPERADRLKTLLETYRVLKPGGLAFRRCHLALCGFCWTNLRSVCLGEPDFVETNEAVLATGVHRNPKRLEGRFTTAYFHLPEEVRQEVVEAGFGEVKLVGLEGPARYLRNFDEVWKDEQKNVATCLPC